MNILLSGCEETLAMQSPKDLTLEDFEFGPDHDFHYGQFSISSELGGCRLFKSGVLISKGIISDVEALRLVTRHLNGRIV